MTTPETFENNESKIKNTELFDDLLMLSALQHIVFCERQCALIHIEQVWLENVLTAEGKILHDKVDTADHEARRNIRIEYGVPLRSLKLGITGKADVVEFHKKGDLWLPFPVEYKRGKPKRDNCDIIQLCAQAICLEEMLKLEIPEGALFYGETRHRVDIKFDQILREETEKTASRLHSLINGKITPKPVYSPKCDSCSLVNICLPKTCGKKTTVSNYLKEIIERF